MRFALALALTVSGSVPVLAGDFPFMESEIDSRFAKAQELVDTDIGFARQGCTSEGDSHACAYTTTLGANVFFGYRESGPVSTIIAGFDESSTGKDAYNFFIVSAVAIHLDDLDAGFEKLPAAADSFIAQLRDNDLKVEVSVGNFSWKYFYGLGGTKDSMFIEAE